MTLSHAALICKQRMSEGFVLRDHFIEDLKVPEILELQRWAKEYREKLESEQHDAKRRFMRGSPQGFIDASRKVGDIEEMRKNLRIIALALRHKLEKLTYVQLMDLARDLALKGYSNYRSRDELLGFIKEETR